MAKVDDLVGRLGQRVRDDADALIPLFFSIYNTPNMIA
jgi:hypothetical protein